MNLNILGPMIDSKSKKLVFMDFIENKTYELKINNNDLQLAEVSKDMSNSCFSDIKKQQESMIPELPIDEINDLMEKKQSLSQQSKNIFEKKTV